MQKYCNLNVAIKKDFILVFGLQNNRNKGLTIWKMLSIKSILTTIDLAEFKLNEMASIFKRDLLYFK